MKTYNISFSKEVNFETLESTLLQYGNIQRTLSNIGVINLQTPDEITKSVLSGIEGVVIVEEDDSLEITSHFEWHQLRVVTPTLPLGDKYNPVNYGENVVIYLMDSGINTEHPEFVNSRIENLYSFNSFFTDDLGHGTALASLINGETLGVAKNCIIKNVRIPFGSVNASQLLIAFDAIVSDHVNTASSVKVVNCSWSVPKSQLIDNKITELQNLGLVVVAAAGNSGIAADSLSPVGLNTVLGVACSDVYDRVISWKTGFSSNYGPEVDITAPGINVNTAKGANEYEIVSGTSVSAAIVSSVVAQYISAFPDYTAQQIQNIVIDNASVDVLFRNETIYGSTPNRLLTAYYIAAKKIWNEPDSTLFYAKKDEITTITLTTNLPLLSVSYDDCTIYNGEHFSRLNFFRKKLPWIDAEFSVDTLTLNIAPSNDTNVDKYSIFIKSIDKNGHIYYTRYVIGVYQNFEDELDVVETEKYFTEENGTTMLLVTPEACYPTCGKGFCCGYYCC